MNHLEITYTLIKNIHQTLKQYISVNSYTELRDYIIDGSKPRPIVLPKPSKLFAILSDFVNGAADII